VPGSTASGGKVPSSKFRLPPVPALWHGGSELPPGPRVSSCARENHVCAFGASSKVGKFASWWPAFAGVKKPVITTSLLLPCQIGAIALRCREDLAFLVDNLPQNS
jgi:hypothetical protein